MKIDPRKLRFCISIGCDQHKGADCAVEECRYPDQAKAIQEQIEKLQEVKYGRSA